jgi:hypothetical protein
MLLFLETFYASVKSVGKNSKNVLKRDVVENLENAEEAGGVISLLKIRKNITKMENMHQKRILKSLEMISIYLKQSITAKKQILDDSMQNQTSAITESDQTSTDEHLLILIQFILTLISIHCNKFSALLSSRKGFNHNSSPKYYLLNCSCCDGQMIIFGSFQPKGLKREHSQKGWFFPISFKHLD